MSAAATPAADLQRDRLLWIVPPAAIAVALLLCIVVTLVAVWIKRRNASERRRYQVREAALAELPPAPASTGATATDAADVTQYADINMALLVRRQEPPAAETKDDDQNHNLTYAQLSFNAGGV